MSKGFLLIDGNNIGNAAQNSKVLKVGDTEVQSVYHSLRAIRAAVAAYPALTPIVLWDGRSWRHGRFPEYKANREKDTDKPLKDYEIKQQHNRDTWKAMKKHVIRGLKLIGVRQMMALNLEADDLVGILVNRYAPQGKKILMITGDQDWLQLVRPGVGWFDPIQDKRITAMNFSEKVGYSKTVKNKELGTEHEEWRGCPSPAAYLDVKCLMGDTGDNIPGVGGIGEKGAYELVLQFGSVANFFNQANLEGVKLPKKLSDFATDETKIARFQLNQVLMDLSHKEIPAPIDLKVTHQAPDDEAFSTFCEEFMFASILKNLPAWLEPFGSVNSDLPARAA
jgi:5'-3' exonuclease